VGPNIDPKNSMVDLKMRLIEMDLYHFSYETNIESYRSNGEFETWLYQDYKKINV
jgi:hypothetical protein